MNKKSKKFTTEIVGLDKFGRPFSDQDINEKNFCKSLGKKFATGASYSKETGIIMQGDLANEMIDFICESFPDNVGDILIVDNRG